MYAAECDIYLTSDMRVVVAHANSDGSINGLDYKRNGYPWANLDVKNFNDGTNTGSFTPDTFIGQGVELSVYNVDKNALMDYYLSYYDDMKAICTNYPKRILKYISDKVAPLPLPDPDEGYVASVNSDNADATPLFYNLQGLQVSNPKGGIFLRHQGNDVTKVVL